MTGVLRLDVDSFTTQLDATRINQSFLKMFWRNYRFPSISALYLVLLLLTIGSIGQAAGIDIVSFDSKEEESRYLNLTQELRCLVCQNQPLADSAADLAKDMRSVVVQKIKDGESDDAIIQFMTDRYGHFVRYQPPFAWHTAILWLAPFALVLLSLLIAPRFIRQQRSATLSAEERVRAQQLLEEALINTSTPHENDKQHLFQAKSR